MAKEFEGSTKNAMENNIMGKSEVVSSGGLLETSDTGNEREAGRNNGDSVAEKNNIMRKLEVLLSGGDTGNEREVGRNNGDLVADVAEGLAHKYSDGPLSFEERTNLVSERIAGLIQKRKDIGEEIEKVSLRINEVNNRMDKGEIERNEKNLKVINEAWIYVGKLEEELRKISDESAEGHYFFRTQELVENSRDIRERGGRLVFTPFVKDKKEEIKSRLERGQMVLIDGETGTGKTEVAKVVAREVTGEEAIVIRGFPGMESEELFGHMALVSSGSGGGGAEIYAQIKQQMEEKRGQDSGWQDKDFEGLEQFLLERANSNVPITEFVLGGIYEAARDGKVVILDEANYIPNGLLAKLNDILTKKPGELINVQEDGVDPIKVKQGFGIIMTANIGDRYKGGRYEFDSALVDRLTNVTYNYLPQTTRGEVNEVESKQKELYAMLLSELMDKDGKIVVPMDDLENGFWKLCKFARISQIAFAGEVDTEVMPEGAMTVEGQKTKLKVDSCISNRVLSRIVEEYIGGLGLQEPKTIDYYLYNELINKVKDNKQRTYLYSLAQTQGLFPVSEGWTNSHKITHKSLDNFRIEGNEKSSIPREKMKIKSYSPIEIVNLIYGESKEGIKFGDSTDEKRDNFLELVEIMKELDNNDKRLRELEKKAGLPESELD
jgi:MoxR-like ATPase